MSLSNCARVGEDDVAGRSENETGLLNSLGWLPGDMTSVEFLTLHSAKAKVRALADRAASRFVCQSFRDDGGGQAEAEGGEMARAARFLGASATALLHLAHHAEWRVRPLSKIQVALYVYLLGRFV